MKTWTRFPKAFVSLAVLLALVGTVSAESILGFEGNQGNTEHPLVEADYAGELSEGVTMTYPTGTVYVRYAPHAHSGSGYAVWERPTGLGYFQFSTTIEIPSMWVDVYNEVATGPAIVTGWLEGELKWTSPELPRTSTGPNWGQYQHVTSGAGIAIDRIEITNYRWGVDDITVNIASIAPTGAIIIIR